MIEAPNLFSKKKKKKKKKKAEISGGWKGTAVVAYQR